MLKVRKVHDMSPDPYVWNGDDSEHTNELLDKAERNFTGLGKTLGVLLLGIAALTISFWHFN